jgi:hypothetical protein
MIKIPEQAMALFKQQKENVDNLSEKELDHIIQHGRKNTSSLLGIDQIDFVYALQKRDFIDESIWYANYFIHQIDVLSAGKGENYSFIDWDCFFTGMICENCCEDCSASNCGSCCSLFLCLLICLGSFECGKPITRWLWNDLFIGCFCEGICEPCIDSCCEGFC